jgi:hypothetical protein
MGECTENEPSAIPPAIEALGLGIRSIVEIPGSDSGFSVTIDRELIDDGVAVVTTGEHEVETDDEFENGDDVGDDVVATDIVEVGNWEFLCWFRF